LSEEGAGEWARDEVRLFPVDGGTIMPVSVETYELVALEDPEGQWELACGRLRSKPVMTTEHNGVMYRLARRLIEQLSEVDYLIAMNTSRLRISNGSYYVPDLCVIPVALQQRMLETPGRFEVYEEPVPLVVEVWSPKTGTYDVEEKLREYQWRNDAEIWRIHPYEKTLTAWQRQPDGSYVESLIRSGTVQPASPPGVTIQLADLFP
jgi:Uma2 family endonuclease